VYHRNCARAAGMVQVPTESGQPYQCSYCAAMAQVKLKVEREVEG